MLKGVGVGVTRFGVHVGCEWMGVSDVNEYGFVI